MRTCRAWLMALALALVRFCAPQEIVLGEGQYYRVHVANLLRAEAPMPNFKGSFLTGSAMPPAFVSRQAFLKWLEGEDKDSVLKEQLKAGHAFHLEGGTRLRMITLFSSESWGRALPDAMFDPVTSLNEFKVLTGKHKGKTCFLFPKYIYPLVPDTTEQGWLRASPGQNAVPGAFDIAQIQAFEVAKDQGDDASVNRSLRLGKVINIPHGSQVMALRAAYSYLEVRILSGSKKGKRLWVPFYSVTIDKPK